MTRFVREGVGLLEEDWRNAVLQAELLGLVPVGQGYSRHLALEGSFESEDVGAVPCREKDVAVVAVSSPPGGIRVAGSPERLAMVAGDDEEGVGVIGGK